MRFFYLKIMYRKGRHRMLWVELSVINQLIHEIILVLKVLAVNYYDIQ